MIGFEVDFDSMDRKLLKCKQKCLRTQYMQFIGLYICSAHMNEERHCTTNHTGEWTKIQNEPTNERKKRTTQTWIFSMNIICTIYIIFFCGAFFISVAFDCTYDVLFILASSFGVFSPASYMPLFNFLLLFSCYSQKMIIIIMWTLDQRVF